MKPPVISVLVWVYRSALVVLPRRFHQRFGPELVALFEETLSRRAPSGLLGAAFLLRALWDLVTSHPSLRRRAAPAPFGVLPRSRTMPQTRSARGTSLLAGLPLDWAYSLRFLRRRPVYVVTVWTTLALGFAAAALVVSLAEAIFLNPFPAVAEVERVVAVRSDDRSTGISYPDAEAIAERTSSLEAVAARLAGDVLIGDSARATTARAAAVSHAYFEVAGVEPVLGRWHRDGGTGEVVVSHAMWRRVFGGDPAVLGSRLQIGGRSFEVVGIAPPRFRGLLLSDPLGLWLPIRDVATVHSRFGEEVLSRRHWHVFDVFARLAPEVAAASAGAELAALGQRLSEEDPGGGARTLPLVPLWDRSVGDRMGAINTLGSIIGTLVLALLVLVVVSAGGLVVARSAERWRELRLRRVLGASGASIYRLLCLEAALLAGGGLGAGLILAWLAMRSLRLLDLPGDLRPEPTLTPFGLMWLGVLGGAVTLLLVGEAWRVWRRMSGMALTPERPRGRGRGFAIACQLALCLSLLAGVGLLLRTLGQLGEVPLGFEPEGVAFVHFDLGAAGYDEARGQEFLTRLLEEVRAQPGVLAAGLISELPLATGGSSMALYLKGGDGSPVTEVSRSIVSPGAFRTLGISLLDGRDFEPGDRTDAPPVVVVNRLFAEVYWPDQRVVGKRLGTSGPGGPFYEVVGVVESHRHHDVRQAPRPHLYWSQGQVYAMMSGAATTLAARTSANVGALPALLVSLIHALDAEVGIHKASTLRTHVDSTLRRERQLTGLFSAVGVVAVVLTVLGFYGLLAASVAQRKIELAIRASLGATPERLQRELLGEGLRWLGIGVPLGLLAALLVGRTLRSLLFGVGVLDPIALGTALIVSVLAVVAACWPAARSAASADIATILRDAS